MTADMYCVYLCCVVKDSAAHKPDFFLSPVFVLKSIINVHTNDSFFLRTGWLTDAFPIMVAPLALLVEPSYTTENMYIYIFQSSIFYFFNF